MKKLITLFLSCVMLLSCAACGTSTTKKENETEKKIERNAEEVSEKETEEISEEKTDSDSKEISRGKISGNKYHSKYSGLTFTKPDSWTFLSDDEIAEAMGVGAELLEEDGFSKAAIDMLSIYDMAVKDNATNTNINITYENLNITGNADITAEEYIDIVEEQLTSLSAMTVTVDDKSEVELSDETYCKMECTTEINGVTMKQIYYTRKIDTYMVNVVVTITDGYSVSEIEEMFS